MKKPFFFIIPLLIVTSSCGLFKKATKNTDANDMMVNDIRSEVESASLNYTNLKLKGTGRFNQPGQNLPFRFEIRMAKDSIIWMDISDPILGLKLARAILTDEEAAFINRLNRQYFKGKPTELQKEMSISMSFPQLFSSLTARAVESQNPWFAEVLEDGNYQLLDYSRDDPEAIDALREQYLKVIISPSNFKPLTQELKEPTNNRVYTVHYKDYKEFEQGLVFPQNILLEFREKDLKTLELNIKRIQKDIDIDYPFNIPSNYAPMR